ncbi:hypothetical protein IG631_22544 [Alternaria alternata]|jgi:hypothetical protein|nr:hypothetical protein IG631_22544 [Alternaria alternata]
MDVAAVTTTRKYKISLSTAEESTRSTADVLHDYDPDHENLGIAAA